MEFISYIDWMQLLRCFITGGVICIIGQILIDKTKLTPARILVTFVTLGVILGSLGIYKYLIDFAGAGATVPLLGFGANLAKGTMEAVKEYGVVGAFIGGVKASAAGIAAAIFFRLCSIVNSKTKNEKTIKDRRNSIFYLYNSYALKLLINKANFSRDSKPE